MLIKWVFVFFPVVTAAYPRWFESYKQQFNKNYGLHVEHKRFLMLEQKINYINENSTLNHGLSLALQNFSDVRNSNLIKSNKILTNYRRLASKSYHKKRHRLGIPSSFDWRSKGFVNDPIAQGPCGGCFAIAAITNLEFWHKKMGGKLLNLSVQEAIDCTRPTTDGCDGGLMEDVYNLAKKNPIGPATFDPFVYHNSRCKRRVFRPYVRVKNFKVMTQEWNSHIEKNLPMNLLKYGPIPIGVDSTSLQFELYQNGILRKQHCGNEIDHAVVVVGYTPSYWIIKNSWGKSWGQNGYFYLERHTGACGINSYSSFATEVEI